MRDAYNDKLVFDADQRTMALVSRASITGEPTHARASKLHLWSRSWNAHLVIDSAFRFPFNDGAMATLENDPEDDLRTAILA